MKYAKEEIEEAKKTLKELLAKADYTVYTILRKVSSSGMYRHISCVLIIGNKPRNIDWQVARVLEEPLKDDGIGIGGSGMDMGYHLVYSLGRSLYPTEEEAQALKIMTNRNNSKDYETDGGYCLNHKWL